MAKTAFGTKVHVGGNIGDPLLNYVDKMKPDDLAILEISSFQLEQMTISPNVAAVLNITPNHLDRHATMEAYTAAKQRILDFQNTKDTAVLCREDPGSWGLREQGALADLFLLDSNTHPTSRMAVIFQTASCIYQDEVWISPCFVASRSNYAANTT